jgi:hypothetical protein
MRFNLLIGLFIIPISTISCEKWRVASEIPEINNLIVVNAALSPTDSVVAVYVGRASDDFGAAKTSGELVINNAEVFIISDETRYQLVFSETNKLYEISAQRLSVKPDKKYRVEVISNGVELTAECTVPRAILPPLLTVSLDKEFIIGKVSWQATASEQAYQLVGNVTFRNNRGFPQQVFGSWDYDNSKLLEAERANQKFNQINTAKTQGPLADTTQIAFEVSLTTYDENASRYLESARNANDSPEMNIEFFNRFITPSIRYSNVKNGIGIVVAYNRQTVIAKLNAK